MSDEITQVDEKIKELNEIIAELQEKKKALIDGDELCNHYWNHSDKCYEMYCTGCDRHIGEHHGDEIYVLLKSQAYCFQCRKTPEQIAQERFDAIAEERRRDMRAFESLCNKYPELKQGE